MKEGIDMNKNARVELLKRVNEEGSKAYKGLVLTESDKSFFLDELPSRKLSRKEVNFFKYVDSYQVEKSKDSKKAEKVDTKDGEQMLLNILDSKEETVKEGTKPVETKEEVKEEVKEKKVSNKKDTNAKKEKLAIAIENYKKEFFKVYGDPTERKKINNFLRCECTNEELFDYFDLSDFLINQLGLSMLKDKAVFILECEGEFERMTIVDKDIKEGRTYLLVKSLDTKNYDRIYLDNWDSKKKVFKHTVGNENYTFKFYMPVLKKGVKID